MVIRILSFIGCYLAFIGLYGQSLYQLPFQKGVKVRCSRSTEHGTIYSEQNAYDFVINEQINYITAARAGKVRILKENSNSGCSNSSCVSMANYVVIDHGDGTEALYLHLAFNSVPVIKDQIVKQGDIIGIMGNTGYSTGPHLHFQVQNVQSSINDWHGPSISISFCDVYTNNGKPVGSRTFDYTAQGCNVTLIKPINNGSIYHSPVEFSWHPVEGATSYVLQVSSTQTFSSVIHQQAVLGINTIVWQNAQPNTEYFWRVRSNLKSIFDANDVIWRFVTWPLPPILRSPINNTTVNTAIVKFDWDDVTDINGTRYRIQVSDNPEHISNPSYDGPFLMEYPPKPPTSLQLNVSEYSWDNPPPNKTLYWRVRANTNKGTSGWASNYFRTADICGTPASPVSISGPAFPCENSNVQYTTPFISGVTYEWLIPTGWAGSSNTNIINVTTSTTSGNIQVRMKNSCGKTSNYFVASVGITRLPAQPSVITGPTTVCANQNQTYSVTAVSGLTYRWRLPTGWTGSSSSNSITVTTGSTSGNVQVEALNSCGGVSTARTLAVSNGGAIPAQPSVITGPTTVCANQSLTYSVTAVSGVTYRWTLPSGWTGSSSTNSITVTTGSTAGNVQVEALNSCGGVSTARTLAVSNGGAIPAQPSVITGPTTVCANQSLTYSVTAVSGVTYRWTLPSGWTGSSSTNSITVTTGSTSGNVQVEALNNCGGVSTARTLAVSNGGAIPAQPGAISGPATLCANQNQTYSVSAVTGVTYRWTLPSGWTGNSSTNSITVTAGSTGGSITVKAKNNCGEGLPRIVEINVINILHFNGSGNWSNPANWENGIKPPNPLPRGNTLLINPPDNGECVLDVPLTINPGANLRVEQGKKFRINGNLIIK
jgi:hypothetical protein